jgi:UDP:flavonoid glycosyltransferase YjiC (YdhE family)
VPVITAGVTEDKPRVGHRVEWAGVGIDLKTATPTQEQVREAVREILSNPSYRERARSFATTRSQADSIEIVAREVEGAITAMKNRKI